MTAPLPNFLIVGAQKSGTRWLRHHLGRCPSVFSAEREIEFFNHHVQNGLGWYSDQFSGWDGEPIVGEATPGYMFHTDDPAACASRVANLLGSDVAIVAVLRDPIDRAKSAYMHHLRRDRIDPETNPLDHFASLDVESEPLGLISGGWYGRSLEPYFERFERMSVEFHSDVKSEPAVVLRRVLHQLGAPVGEADSVSAELGDVLFSGVPDVAERFSSHPILTVGGVELSDCLAHHYDADTRKLEVLLGRQVPWRDRVIGGQRSSALSDGRVSEEHR